MKSHFGEILLEKMYIYEMLFVRRVVSVLSWFVMLDVNTCDYVTT